MKKIISILLTVTMLCGTIVTVFAADAPSKEYPQKFYDVPKDHWAFSYIAELADRGVIAGYEDGSFKPNATVTRAEWAKIMVGAAGIPTNDNNVYFSDMQNHWAITYVNAAKDYLTAYSDNTYRPSQAAVREDVTMAMVKLKGYDLSNVDYSYLANFTDTDSISNNIKQYVAVAVEKGLISGFEDNTFRGQATITRAEAATLLWRAFQYGNDNKVVDTSNNVAPSQTVATPSTTQDTQIAPTPTPTQTETVAEPTPVATEKPYKVDTLVKANVKDRYYYTYDSNNTIYYVENNTVYSVDVNTGSKNTVLSADELVIDNDEMTLEDFEIDNVFYDVNNNALGVAGEYKTVKTANNVNPYYCYAVRNSNVISYDEWENTSKKFIGVLDSGDLVGNGEFLQDGSDIYYWGRWYGTGTLYIKDVDNFQDANNCRGDETVFESTEYAGFGKDYVMTATNDGIFTAYNFKGKELYKITADDYEIKDANRSKLNLENIRSLIITSNNNIIFYDTNAKAFRMISEN